METRKQSTGMGWKGLLIVTVLVIAIVAAILNYAGESAKQRQCLANLRLLWSASMMYAQDHDGWMPIYINEKPSKHRVGGVIPVRGIESPEKLRASLSPYVKKESAWFCPSDIYAGQETDVGCIWHATSSYDFKFCQPGVLRSSGLVKGISQTWVEKFGTPSKYGLIYDYLARTEQGWRGPHPGGRMNAIYLDGHIE